MLNKRVEVENPTFAPCPSIHRNSYLKLGIFDLFAPYSLQFL